MRSLLLIILLLLSSCATRKMCARKYPPHTFERERIEVTERARVISLYRAGSEAIGGSEIVIKEGEIKVVPSFLRTEFAWSRAWVENNQLRHQLVQEEINLRDTVYVPEIKYIKETGETVYINQLKTWQQVMIVLGICFVGALGLVLARALRK